MKSKLAQVLYLLLFPCLLFSQAAEDIFHVSDRTKFYVELNAGLGLDLKRQKTSLELRAMPSIIRFSFGLKVNKYLGLGLGGGVDNYQDENFPYYVQFNGYPLSFGKVGLNYVLRIGALVEDVGERQGISVFHPSIGLNFNTSKRKEMTIRLAYLSSPQRGDFNFGQQNQLLMLELGVLFL